MKKLDESGSTVPQAWPTTDLQWAVGWYRDRSDQVREGPRWRLHRLSDRRGRPDRYRLAIDRL